MKIYFIFSQEKFLNSYLVANEKTGEAIFIDPLKISLETIKLIQKHNYNLTHLLFTHGNNLLQWEGILTASKIYKNLEIVRNDFCNCNDNINKSINNSSFKLIGGDGKLELAGLNVEYFFITGLAPGAFCYKIENVVFLGNALIAGQIGKTSSNYATQNLQKALWEKIFTLKKDLLLFPLKGPPTSIAVENLYNQDLTKDKIARTKKWKF